MPTYLVSVTIEMYVEAETEEEAVAQTPLERVMQAIDESWKVVDIQAQRLP